MRRDITFRFRVNEYEREVIRELTKRSQIGTTVLTDSDIVRVAIFEMAKRYMSPADLNRLKSKYNVKE